MTRQDLCKTLDNLTHELAYYLSSKQQNDGSFPAREFYGKAFSILLWDNFGDEFIHNIEKSMNLLHKELSGEPPPNYHFEFIWYALLKKQKNSYSEFIDKQVLDLTRYTGTRVANWTLLRTYCRYASGLFKQKTIADIEINIVKLFFTKDSGLIEDQRGAYSMQYHAFCLALIGEMLNDGLVEKSGIIAWFFKSINRFCSLILDDGQCNYIGRGSFQSFGYGAAVLALSHAYILFGDIKYLDYIRKILSFLTRYKRKDNSFSLVITLDNEGDPDKFSLKDRKYTGWWSYNNYYDYLPFMGAMLRLSFNLLKEDNFRDKKLTQVNIHSDGIIKNVMPGYVAVHTLPNNYVAASSLPIPFVQSKTMRLTPCYGGEQQQDSLFNMYSIPLPYLTSDVGDILFSESKYNWKTENEFYSVVMGHRHTRCFKYYDASIEICDTLQLNGRSFLHHVYIPRFMLIKSSVIAVEDKKIICKSMVVDFEDDIEVEDKICYSPNGELISFVMKKNKPCFDTMSCNYKITPINSQDKCAA